MNIETTPSGTLLIIGIMASVTLATRWGGVWVMSFMPLNHRVQQFISAMAGSVLVAILTPMAINGDAGARLALLVTAFTMVLVKKPLVAITAGVLAAALWRHFY